MATLIFGTSGWSYKEWVGPFYERTERMFSYYARFFSTAEINSTFYRYPSKSSIEGLNRASPNDFVFSTKLPRLITHEKHLDPEQGIKADLARFLETMDPLASRSKLGCILIQLPPSFAYERDRENLETFLEMLPSGYEFAVEFRNHSWMRDDSWKLLGKHNVAYCIVDEPLLPPEVHITADFAYFRWHGRGTRPWYDYHYSEEQLREWVPRLERTKNEVGKIYGYFNNHYHGYAVENCVEILEMLNAGNPEQQKIKEKVIRHNSGEKPRTKERKLEEFGFGTVKPDFTDPLLRLTDRGRLERAAQIEDNELAIEQHTEKLIRARIRDYTIEIDFLERTLKHNCDDWSKSLGTKRLCKHIVKLLLMLPPVEARGITEAIMEAEDSWSFELL